jgi:hypothetical protein
MGEARNAYRVSVGEPEGKRLLGRPRRRWVDNIKMDLKRERMRRDGLDRTGSGLGTSRTLVKTVMNLRVP